MNDRLGFIGLTGEDDSDAEEEEDTSDRKTLLRVLGIDLTVDDGFADQGDGNSDGSPQKRLASSDTVNHEDDEDEI